MFSLSNSEQIEMRDFVKSTLNTPTYCYWLIKDGTIPFENNEYILEEGEYFFYTNNAKTELVTLGSGTKLTRTGTLEFSLNDKKDEIDIDSVANNGIGAFANDPWKQMKFNGDSSHLDIQEMQIRVLVEGDTIISMVPTEEHIEDEYLTNDWIQITSMDYRQGVDQQSLPVFSGLEDVLWSARSRLIINIGPNTPQEILDKQYPISLFTINYFKQLSAKTHSFTGTKLTLVITFNFLFR